MAMEDGVVLGEILGKIAGARPDAATLDGALEAFMARRLDRCALVVDTSLALGRLERAAAAPAEQQRLVEAALARLNQPY
jgi:2-polyprenyl-6-methoxyphenol hydroxylase-like FAD-dependent oxidoreductase